MKISVAMCKYNGAKYLPQQLDSIMQQSLEVDEIVVCNDCSTDTTHEILKNYTIKFTYLFKIYSNETNLGSSKNFEKAMQLASGDLIFFADQDDVWKKEKVKKVKNIFIENPNAIGVFSDAELIDDQGNLHFKELSLWSSVKFWCNGHFSG